MLKTTKIKQSFLLINHFTYNEAKNKDKNFVTIFNVKLFKTTHADSVNYHPENINKVEIPGGV